MTDNTPTRECPYCEGSGVEDACMCDQEVFMGEGYGMSPRQHQQAFHRCPFCGGGPTDEMIERAATVIESWIGQRLNHFARREFATEMLRAAFGGIR